MSTSTQTQMPVRKVIEIAQQLQVPPKLTLRGGNTVQGEIVATGPGGVQLLPYSGKGLADSLMIRWDQIAAWSLPAVSGEVS